MLLQLAKYFRQQLADHLRRLVLLLLLAMVLLPTVMLLSPMVRPGISSLSSVTTSVAGYISRAVRLAALEVDVDPARILFGPVSQAHLPTQLLDLGLQLLHVAL